MRELLSLQTEDFEVVVWSKSITDSQRQLARTLEARKLDTPNSTVFFNPEVRLATGKSLAEYPLGSAVFFENKVYEIEVVFNNEIAHDFDQSSLPYASHPLNSVEDGFRYDARTKSLRGSFNPGNELGRFSLGITYLKGRLSRVQKIGFDVLPTKLDLHGDIAKIGKEIDQMYPLWRYSLVQKTQLNHRVDRTSRQDFPLIWLAQFERLWDEFDKGLKKIVNSPHTQLVGISQVVRLDALRGKLRPALQHRVREAVVAGDVNYRVNVRKKRLTLDSPENRFIKFVVTEAGRRVAQILELSKVLNEQSMTERISKSFFQGLEQKKQVLQGYRNHRMFREVGRYVGSSRESLVLQQKPGYAKVYKTWQQLKWFLESLGDETFVSVRNVAEQYEVWCFLQIRASLLELGFVEVQRRRAALINHGLRVSMRDGLAGAFEFTRSDGVSVRLAHEPIFDEKTRPIRTWMTSQKPDIVVKVSLPDESELVWVFDAKYRVESSGDGDYDRAPEDAINQMHRYRDSLIHHVSYATGLKKSRPVFGAYVLYPGFFDQTCQINPYLESIKETGIGAFALLPSEGVSGRRWIAEFLRAQLGNERRYSETDSDRFFVEEPVRIPYSGTSVRRYDDLTAVFSGKVDGRSTEYHKKLSTGTMDSYHTMLVATERQSIEQHVVEELQFLCISVVSEDKNSGRISVIYPIESVGLVPRKELSYDQTGTTEIDEPERLYWFFQLGTAIALPNTIEHPIGDHFSVTITRYRDILATDNLNGIRQYYGNVLEFQAIT